MASQSSVIGLLRVLLSANTAEFDTRLKTSQTVAKDFGTSIQGVAKSLKELSGENLLKSANNTVAAIEKLGGVQKLTAAEQAKVNAELTRAIEKYTALGIQAPKALTDVANATKQVEQPTSRLGGILTDFGKTFGAVIAGMISAQAIIGGVTAAWRTLTEFIASSVKAYSDQEAAVKKMTTALNAQGNATPQVIKQFKDMASQFQQTTVFSDELINEMQALLVQVGNVLPHEMEAALEAATNLASGLGIDLRTATMLVGKAFEGETGTLKRYGIVIDETKLKTEGVTAVLDAIQSKFGGQAQSEAETYAGKIKQIANAWSELQEVVGEFIISSPIVEASLRSLKLSMEGGTGAVIDHDHAWSNLLLSVTKFAGSPMLTRTAGFVRELEDMAKAANDAHSALSKLQGAAPTLATNAPIGFPAGTGEIIAKELKAPTAAVDAWLKSIKALREELSGARLQTEVKRLAEAFSGLNKADPKVLDRVAESAHKLWQQGAILTPQLYSLIVANGNLAASLPPVERGLGQVAQAGQMVNDHFKNTLAIVEALIPQLKVVAGLGSEFKGVGAIPVPTMPPIDKALEEQLRRMKQFSEDMKSIAMTAGQGVSQALADGIISGDWSHLQQALRDVLAQTIGGALTSAVNFLIPGLGTMLAPLFNAFGTLISNLFGNRGRDMVKDFAETFGGFDPLHAKLLELGDEGERLWKRLTQGVGRNNPQEAAAAIAAVTEALARGAQKTVEATKQIDAAAKQLVDTLKSELASLTSEIDTLTQSIADEMPEEVMGVVEQQTRARIAAIEAERDRVEEELRLAGEAIGETAEAVGDTVEEHIGGSIRDVGSDLDRNKTEWSDWGRHVGSVLGSIAVGVKIPQPPSFTPSSGGSNEPVEPGESAEGFSSGTPNLDFANFGQQSQVMLHSKEAVVPQSHVGQFAGQVATALSGSTGGSSGVSSTVVIMEMDKREFARAMVDVFPNETRRLGVRIRN